ncbi:dna-directed rna polymerase i [Vairimorpha ceranae]|uniref:Dna-directed rna polymerase i n=1 Tax=Vairimorpha ceranae TaxID=40302 RepID=A0A0F9WD73_9MICR|nr:dna-directed rna polymerase i [Vairimorpha ceranae]KKO75386.1 dna-directed rna polymerase i [Vairimorpha ceranae]
MLVLNKKYKVECIDKEGKLYQNVSRAYLQCNNNDECILDYHSTLIRLNNEDVLNIQIYDNYETEVKCDYQMNGTIYQIEDYKDKIKVHASFGGLLMIQTLEKDEIQGLTNRSKISCLVSKI